NIYVQPRLSQNNGCSQPIRSGADDACLTVHFTNHPGAPAGSGKNYCCGRAAGHSVTTMLPSGFRSSVGAYRPKNCRRHHIPVARFSAMLVNQYCQSTARICRGGSCGKGLPAKRDSTSLSLESSRTSVFGTIGYSRQEP